MLTIARAKEQIKDSIEQYQKLKTPFVPNDPAVDSAILSALEKATTWQQVGLLAFLLPARMPLLQKPIDKIDPDYTKTVPMQFDVGQVGWYWLYSTTLDCKNGFLACVFRVPTKANSTDLDSIFTLCGYVVDNGKTRPMSSLAFNLACPGSYTEKDGTYTLLLDLSSYSTNRDVFVNSFSISGPSSDFKTITTSIGFKTAPSYVFTQTSKTDGAFEGKQGCAPCIGGAGTNYWSFTYMTGKQGSNDLIGWFDHQWFNGTPHSTTVQLFDAVLNTVKKPIRTSWIFVSMQPSEEVQYTASYVESKNEKTIANLRVGSVLKGTSNKFEGTKVTYDIPCTITVDSFMPQDPRLPNALTIKVDGKTYQVKAAVDDGRIVLPNGTVNLEALSQIFEGSTTPIGVGCIEINAFHDAVSDIIAYEKLAGIDAPASIFEAQKPPASTSAAAIGIIVAVVLVIILLIIGLGFAIRAILKKKE